MTTQALNRPVDVLAKIRAACDSDALPYEVYCAVAELVEATKQISNLYGHLWDVTEPVGAGFLSPESVAKYDAAHDRLHAALAAVEGQP